MSRSSPHRDWIAAIVVLIFLLQCNSLEQYLAAPPPLPTPVPVENRISDLYLSRTELLAGETADIQVGVVKVVGTEVPLVYDWNISSGSILQGQGTCCITYQAPETPGAYQINVSVRYNQETVQRSAAVQVIAPEIPAEPTPTPTLVQSPTAAPKATDTPLDTAEAYFERAQERYSRREIEGTLADYAKAIELNYQPLSEPTYNLAYIHYTQQDYAPAIEGFTKAIELNYEPLSLPYYNRGNARFYLGKTKEAIEDYTKAIELKHEPLAWLYNSRGLAYRKLKEYDKAIADYTQAIELEHDPLSWPFYNRANAFADKGAFDQALLDYTESLNLDPTNANAYFGRAMAYKALGDASRALIDLGEAANFGDEFMKQQAQEQVQALEGGP